MPEDKTLAGTCPVCGGKLCVDVQYPDRIYCDTCEYEYGMEMVEREEGTHVKAERD